MPLNRHCLPILLAAALGLSAQPALAAEDAHHSHAAGHAQLRLDHGKKWPTDGALRQGMSEIRSLVATALPKAHAGRLDAAGYATLADGIMAQVDYLTANCKLPLEADAQLHIVLADIIAGTEKMRSDKAPVDGVVKVLGGVDAYGKHFDHPGWKPLKH